MIVNKSLKSEISRLITLKYDKQKLGKYFKERDNKWNDADVSKVEVYFWDINEKGESKNVASRVTIDDSFTSDKIKRITDTGIQRIMLNHLHKYHIDENGKIHEHPEIAFSPDGVDEMNKTIQQLNEGKSHQPIYKVRTFEPKGGKFNVGLKGNKKDKYVEAAKGTNLFFAIYKDEKGKRVYETIPLNIIIERQKQGLTSVPETNEAGHSLLFHLSPNDLVLVPTPEKQANGNFVKGYHLHSEQIKRVYKFVSCTENEGHFVPNSYSSPILKNEFGSNNKNQNAMDGTQIKAVCLKLKIDRLGNISFNSKHKYSTADVEAENILYEPNAVHQKKTQIRTFNSFEEINEGDAQELAAIPPITHLHNATMLAKKIYAEALKLPMDMTINFK